MSDNDENPTGFHAFEFSEEDWQGLTREMLREHRKAALIKRFGAETDDMTAEQKLGRLKLAFRQADALATYMASLLNTANSEKFKDFLLDSSEYSNDDTQEMIQSFILGLEGLGDFLELAHKTNAKIDINWARYLTLDLPCVCPTCLRARMEEKNTEEQSHAD